MSPSVTEVLLAQGAPVDQGLAQGRELRDPITRELRRLRTRHGLLSRQRALRHARREAMRPLTTQLPQQGERLQGIAEGARVSPAALALADTAHRVSGVGFHSGTCIQASLELPAELEPLLVLRASRPDAGGFPSVELTCAPFAGCLAGVNSQGMAVICLEDRARDEPSLRFLAGELVFRASELDAGIDHVCRRARYLGGTGLLLICDASGAARWLRLRDGDACVEEAPARELLALEPQLVVDSAERSLVFADCRGRERVARLDT